MSTVLRPSAWVQETNHIVNWKEEIQLSCKHIEIGRAHHTKTQFFFRFERKTLNHRNAKYSAVSNIKSRAAKARCCCLSIFGSGSGHPLSINRATTSLFSPRRAIFANVCSLRDLRCTDSLVKEKHKSQELCTQRFIIIQRCYFGNWKCNWWALTLQSRWELSHVENVRLIEA